jgi:glycosyltransferase involved in cell wall biosynthesis
MITENALRARSGHDRVLPPPESLRICLASVAPFIGGAEIAAERLAVGLRQLGHEVFLVLGGSGPVQERMEKAGLRCIVSPMYRTDKWHWLRYVKARNRLSELLRREQPDLVHSNDLPSHQILSDAARRLNVPRICHHRFLFEKNCIDWLNKFGAEAHFFVSHGLMKAMCARSARMASGTRVVVYDGLTLPPKPTEADRRHARLQLQLPADKVLVVYAGLVSEAKGIPELLRAWSLLDPNLIRKADLLIVGDDLQGPRNYRSHMQNLAHQLNCSVRFVGFQSNVSPWLVASDLAVVPSHWESLGNATLEAMAHALPVVGSDVGGIPEMIMQEHTGLLVPSRSPEHLSAALARLIAEPETRQRFGQEGRLRCEDCFSLEAHVATVVREYQQVLFKARAVPIA